MKLVVPTIHMNGSGRDSLLEQYREGCAAVQNALDKLPSPHGRDYYPQTDPDATQKAIRQAESQADRLRSVYSELETIVMAIVDAP